MRFSLKIFFCSCLLLFAAAPTFGGEWRKQRSGTLSWLHSVYFHDARHGWIAGSNGTLLNTTDGGATWRVTAKPAEDNLRDVFFTDENNGWLLAERDVLELKSPSEARSYLLRTT